MRIQFLILLVLGIATSLVLVGCSSSSADRTAYETLQNIGQQDCRKDPSANCPRRESYDDYQRQRKTLDK